jgi:hypothetical protein
MRYDHSPEASRSNNLGRIAIWNKTKIVFAIAMVIWITDSSLYFLGKYLLLITGESLVYQMILQLQFR